MQKLNSRVLYIAKEENVMHIRIQHFKNPKDKLHDSVNGHHDIKMIRSDEL